MTQSIALSNILRDIITIQVEEEGVIFNDFISYSF